MGAFADLPKFLGKSLVEIAKELNYSEANILVLQDDRSQLAEKYPLVLNNIDSCTHHRDNRTPMQYAQDLVASWIFEDYLVKILSDAGLTIGLAGADKNRQILSGAKVSAASDTVVTYNGKQRLLEIMTDYSGYWKRSGKLHLRDSKYNKMEKSNSLFIGFSTVDKKYLFIDFTNEVEAKYIPSHYPYGYKPAYEISLKDNGLKDFTAESIIKDIKEAF